MKQYTQSELQKMYMEPSEELKNRIHQEISSLPIREQEENIVKRKLSFSFVSVIAILLVLVAVAYAATEVYHRITVNWKGETVRETEVPAGPEATAVPLADAQITILNDEDLDRMADELLRSAVAEDEYGVVSYETPGGTVGRISPVKKSFGSWDEFREYMNHSSELTLPAWIPDGYGFQEAQVMISCKADGEYKLIEERQEGAITLKRYRIDDSDSVVEWYVIVFRESGENNHYLIAGSSLNDPDADGRTFDLTDGQSASVMTIPGMDNALAIVDSNDPTYNRLAMIRRLDRPVEYRMGPVYDDQHTPAESTVSTYESIDVSSPWLDIETLQKIFTPE